MSAEVPLYLEVAPVDGSGQYSLTVRETRQANTESEIVAVKQESEDAVEVKELLFKDILNLTDTEDNTQPQEKCSECHFSTKDADRMMRHVRKVHRGLNPFQCYMCDYSTYNKVLFEEHVRIHKGIKPFKCSYCDYCSVSKKNAKKHEAIHRPDNPLKCQHCPFIARHHRALVCHRKTHRDSGIADDDVKTMQTAEGIKCDNCGDWLKNNKALAGHRSKRRRCKEPDCDAILCSKHSLKSHMSNVHHKHQDKERVFQCEVCEFSTNSSPRMLLHLIHHPNQTVDESVLDISILRRYGIMV